MPAFCSLLLPIHYAKNFASEIDGSLIESFYEIHAATATTVASVCKLNWIYLVKRNSYCREYPELS